MSFEGLEVRVGNNLFVAFIFAPLFRRKSRTSKEEFFDAVMCRGVSPFLLAALTVPFPLGYMCVSERERERERLYA